MELQESKNGLTLVVEVAGQLDTSTAPELERRLAELLKEGERYFLFDLSHLEHIDSAGLRVLLMLARRLGGLDGKMALHGLSRRVKEVFDVAAFTGFFQMTASRRTAFQALPPDVSLTGLADFIGTRILSSEAAIEPEAEPVELSPLRLHRATSAVARLLCLPSPEVSPGADPDATIIS